MTTKKFTPTITRGPRLTPGEISLTPPDDLGIDIPPSGVQKILPYVMGGAMLGMIAIMVAGGTRQLSPYMLMMPLMMIVMMVGGLAGSTGGGGKKVPEINADRKEYLRYLAGLRTRVTSSATSQVAFFSYHAPHPEDLLSIVGTQRQWSRPANADFYAATRIGIGDQPAVDRLLKPAVGGELAAASAAPSRWRMYTDTDRDRLKIPFGHELKTGNVMYLDIKEGAEFGAGPHGMLIGTTGSGKSEFLRTLILSLVAMTHPDQVNLLLTDFKGGSTFLGMEKLPHTAAVVTNMAEEAELVSRMGEVLTGELDRRQSILRQAGMKVGAAGALSGVAEYEKYRERGADLPPLPTLFVVVDEFAELLQSHPDFIGLFDRICRVGRSLRVHLLLATQSLQTGGVRIDKLEPNLTYRIALRTTSSHESKAVIGTPEAQYITNKESGVGFLRVGMEDPVKFSTFYISGPYMPPAAGVETNGEAGGPGQQTTRQAARIHRFTAAPVLEEAPTP